MNHVQTIGLLSNIVSQWNALIKLDEHEQGIRPFIHNNGLFSCYQNHKYYSL